MFSYAWPIGLAVLSNVVYHICCKSVPENLNPFASLSITYTVSAAACILCYFLFNKNGNLLHEYRNLNWAPFVLGIVIIGLEIGFTYAYKAGWEVGTAALVQSAFLAVILLFVGALLYHEALTWNKIVGMLVCIGGLVLINMK